MIERPCPNMTFEERVVWIGENWTVLLMMNNFIIQSGAKSSAADIGYLSQYCNNPTKHKDVLDQVCNHIYDKGQEAQRTIAKILPLLPETETN